MATINVDPQRLNQLAQALGSAPGQVNQARSELDAGTSAGATGCGSGLDGGLIDALSRFRQSWNTDLEALASKLSAISQTISTIATLYAAEDNQGTQAIGGGGS